MAAGLEAALAKAEGNCAIDYGFHMIVSDVNEQSCKEMDMLVDEGVTSFKLFMAYPGVFYSTDGEILRAMQQARTNGATVMMHAENGIAIDVLVSQALSRGETDPLPWPDPPGPAGRRGDEPRHRPGQGDGGASLHRPPVHHRARLEAVAQARSEGQNAFAETCPQYLFLSDRRHLARPDSKERSTSAPRRCGTREHQANLWRGCAPTTSVGGRHRPLPLLLQGAQGAGVGDFSKIPNGLPGVEHRVDLTYQGVRAGEITLERWVEVNATTPARMFGLYPKKGVLAPGSDADIVLYDPAATHTISAATHHMNVDYSAYEGMQVRGQGRHGAVSGARSSSRTIRTSASKGHGPASSSPRGPTGTCDLKHVIALTGELNGVRVVLQTDCAGEET
jgi:dihydropyrimidinase